MKKIEEYLIWENVLASITEENFNDSLDKIVKLLEQKSNLGLSFNEKDLSDLRCQFLAELIKKTPNLTSI